MGTSDSCASGRDRSPFLRWTVAGACLAVVFLPVAAFSAGSADSKGDSDGTTAKNLIQQSMAAAADGSTAKQFALLRKAVLVEPENPLAHWHLGQMKVDGEWIAVEEAQRRAAANPNQVKYRELRAEYGESPEGQLALARWCRKMGLEEEAQFHWASVLSIQPNHEEALRALGVRWYGGQLLTSSQIELIKDQRRELKAAVKQWRPQVERWRRAASHADSSVREAALKDIRGITATEAIPALEEITLGTKTFDEDDSSKVQAISLALIEALDAMPGQGATGSLLRHSVYSPLKDVRAAAIERLKKRPLHDYVPALLDSMAMPIESSFSVITDGSGSVHYRHSLYREGANSDWSRDARHSVIQNDFAGRRLIYNTKTREVIRAPNTESRVEVAMKKANVASRYQGRYANTAAATEWQVAQINSATTALNARIVSVLEGTTSQALGGNAKAWWEWWLDYNEYHADEKPVKQEYYADTDHYHYRYPQFRTYTPPPPPPPPRPRGRYSCFAKGTLVWTKTGQRPIESLEIGELVLAQDSDTGELAYKPIIGRTVRPPSPTVTLKFNDGELCATLGHPIWVTGVGWRMAKELEDGALIHAVTGACPLERIEESADAEAYNLVVADFNTYFVGEQGILVHDNMPRKPSRAAAPGIDLN